MLVIGKRILHSSVRIDPQIIFSILLVLIAPSTAQWKPQDVFRISCGDSGTDPNGLQWTPDSQFVSGGTVNNATGGMPLPYRTARIFTNPASYSFSVSPGRHWVRLHFAPPSRDAGRAHFSVSIGQRVLVAGSTVAEAIASGNGSAPVVREFTIHASGTALAIAFSPGGGGGGTGNDTAIAFVSGIELISMPRDALSSSVVEISPDSTDNRQVDITGILAATAYRLNVGGDAVSPGNDTSTQGRTWLPDAPFLQGVARGVAVPPAVSDIVYPATVPEYIAPRGVYGTARSLGGSNTVTNAFNISWGFAVLPGYPHYVRLHFAELVYNSPMQRIFSVYINNRTAIRALDLIQQTGAANTPYYKDFLVLPVAGLSSIRIQIGPLSASNSQVQDAILNGLEIFRFNDSSGNVDGLATVLPGSSDGGRGGGSKVGVIVGSVAGGVFAVVAVGLAVMFFCCKGKGGGKQPGSGSWQALGNGHQHQHHHGLSLTTLGSTMGAGSPRSVAGSYYNAGSASAGGHGRYFTFQEIVEATNGFDEARLLGVGGFGRVYKGEIDNGTLEVAVKRGSPRSEQGIAEFQAEIGLLSKLRHRHLVSLIGYCDEQSEMILVYEYMARGPLRGHLYGSEVVQPLSWRHRLEILVGAARGLHYLHTGADHTRAIIHRDVKTTNILLDEQLVAKVSDFGLSKTGPMLDQTHVSTAVKGSFGYLDPEYFRRQQLTDKSDVYSFGVVMVEVMCARAAIDPGLPREQVNIAEWAMSFQRRGRLAEILDPGLARPGAEVDADMVSVRKVGETAEKCLQEHGIHRPTMGEVLWNLESALHVQDAAERRYRSENGGGAAAEEVPAATTGSGVVPPVPTARPSDGHRPASGVMNDDYYDGYSEDASASAVFSQLVNPQGR